MKQIETEIVINASPEKVWSVLTDFTSYPAWNPFIRSIEGEKRSGGRLRVSITPPGGGGMTFKPIVLTFDPQLQFRWKGKLGIAGIFDGEHYFQLSEQNNTTRFVHGEKFSGVLVPFMAKILEKTSDGFQQMNLALKRKCETK
jgi:hypothetical protein